MRFQGLRMCDETAMQFVKRSGDVQRYFDGKHDDKPWQTHTHTYIYIYIRIVYNSKIESGFNLRFALAMVNARHQLDTARILAAQYVDAW